MSPTKITEVTLPNGKKVPVHPAASAPESPETRSLRASAARAGATAKLPADRRAAVLLSHRPSCAREAAKLGFDLQLSGHTHGGMVIGFDRLIACFNGGYVSGEYHVGAMTLYVSNGTGIWSGFPIRIGRPSEITLVTLRLAQ